MYSDHEHNGNGHDGNRMFFALWPDADLRVQMRRITSRLVRRSGGRRVHPDNLHLTVSFLGNVPPERIPCVEAIAERIAIPRFRMALDRLGYFPGPRVVWLGCADCPPELLDLAERLNDGLPACGLVPEDRVLIPHVTLLRKSTRAPGQLEVIPQTWDVNEFHLVESANLAEGARYRIVRSWPLR